MRKRHKNKLRSIVHIVDAKPGEKSYTSPRAAARYVKEERAEWADPYRHSIRFKEADPRHVTVTALLAAQRAQDLAAGGMATIDQIRGVPVIQPVKVVTDRNSPRTRKGRRVKGRRGPVVIVTSSRAA